MKPRSTKRVWLFRVGAVLLAVAPFIAFELCLRALGLPREAPAIDPFVDLHNLEPLFEPSSADPALLVIGDSRRRFFRPASFRDPKPPDTFRVFALGGSTTQGEPYSTESAFPIWLGICLQTVSEQQIEIINCGGLSYASYRVLAILKEILDYQPDLVVIYTGQNEYLERRSYASQYARTWNNRALSAMSQLRTIQISKQWLGRDANQSAAANGDQTELSREVDALLDYEGGLADYRRGDSWHTAVPAHFEWNLNAMVRECRARAIPLVMIKPVSNLRDCPPLKYETNPALTAELANEFELQFEIARQAGNTGEAVGAAQVALRIDPEHAGANYLVGSLMLADGDGESAKAYLERAKDHDVCPLRATREILGAVSRVAAQQNVPLVDAEHLFAARSEHGIVGANWLVDHIHPSVQGHQLLGEAIAATCFEYGLLDLHPAPNWRDELPSLFEQHLETLGEEYFHRGKQRLEGLLLWTQGRAKKLRE